MYQSWYNTEFLEAKSPHELGKGVNSLLYDPFNRP